MPVPASVSSTPSCSNVSATASRIFTWRSRCRTQECGLSPPPRPKIVATSRRFQRSEALSLDFRGRSRFRSSAETTRRDATRPRGVSGEEPHACASDPGAPSSELSIEVDTTGNEPIELFCDTLSSPLERLGRRTLRHRDSEECSKSTKSIGSNATNPAGNPLSSSRFLALTAMQTNPRNWRRGSSSE